MFSCKKKQNTFMFISVISLASTMASGEWDGLFPNHVTWLTLICIDVIGEANNNGKNNINETKIKVIHYHPFYSIIFYIFYSNNRLVVGTYRTMKFIINL